MNPWSEYGLRNGCVRNASFEEVKRCNDSRS